MKSSGMRVYTVHFILDRSIQRRCVLFSQKLSFTSGKRREAKGDFGHIDESEVWPAELKQIGGHDLSEREQAILDRRDCIPTLGNLTLLNLSVNREAQAKAFDEKRSLLVDNTNLRLNVPLVARESWDEITITDRSAKFAAAAVSIWPKPDHEGTA